MKELLLEQLKEYQDGVTENEAICLKMMKDDVDDFILTTQLKKNCWIKNDGRSNSFRISKIHLTP